MDLCGNLRFVGSGFLQEHLPGAAEFVLQVKGRDRYIFLESNFALKYLFIIRESLQSETPVAFPFQANLDKV